jgi:glyoxylase-like metal-dependent hydrolase (beta-lactamase superfamily II)
MFSQLAERVYVLPYPVLKVNCTLVIGDERALLIDTLSTDDQATELGAAVRALTDLPLTLVNTHFHYDHSFGNATLAGPDTEIWASQACADELRDRGRHWQLRWQDEIAAFDQPLALAVGQVTLRPPDRVAHGSVDLDLGGVTVTLVSVGRGHTDGDLVARVGDLVVAGDLIESGAPPDFADSYPLDWPQTLATVTRLGTMFVPGHGPVMTHDEVIDQHDGLARLEWLIRDGHADGASVQKVAHASELTRWGETGREQALHAVRRGFGQLDVRIDG